MNLIVSHERNTSSPYVLKSILTLCALFLQILACVYVYTHETSAHTLLGFY